MPFSSRCYPVTIVFVLLSGCGGGGGGGDAPAGGGGPTSYRVSTSVGDGGSINPGSVTVAAGRVTTLTISEDPGYVIDTVSGCDGTLNDGIYTTGTINADCAVVASFRPDVFDVTGDAGVGGRIAPGSSVVDGTDVASFAVVPSEGYEIAGVFGCGATLDRSAFARSKGVVFITSPIVSDCTVYAVFDEISAELGHIDLEHRSPEQEPNVDTEIIDSLLFCTNLSDPLEQCPRWNYASAFGSPVTLRYSFSGLANGFPEADVENISYRDFLESEKEVIRDTLQQVEDATQLQFIETTDIYGQDVINFVIIASGSSMAFLPPASQADAEGAQGARVRYNERVFNLLDREYWVGPGEWAWDEMHDRASARYIIAHEIGHTLGLKHPFQPDPTLPITQENDRYTVMTYGGCLCDVGLSPDHLNLATDSFQKYDLLALQTLYGLNDPDAGEPRVFSFSDDYTRRVVVHDVNQNATLNFSATLRDAIIDLRPGAFSSYAVNLVEYVNDTYGNYQNRSYNNMALSYDTHVAQVRAGSGNDFITNGVSVTNVEMGQGNDVLLANPGATGNVIVSGEGGADMVSYPEALSQFSVQPTVGGAWGDVSVEHIVSGVTYTLRSVEFLVFDRLPVATTELCDCAISSDGN